MQTTANSRPTLPRFFCSNPRYWAAIAIGFVIIAFGIIVSSTNSYWSELIVGIGVPFVIFGIWFGISYAYIDLRKP